MRKDLTQDERLLADLMSELSERCYSAGWMKGLEYILWDAVTFGPRDYGQDKIISSDIDKLIRASDKAKSWILFDDELEEIAVPLEKWKIRFTEETSKNPDLLHR